MINFCKGKYRKLFTSAFQTLYLSLSYILFFVIIAFFKRHTHTQSPRTCTHHTCFATTVSSIGPRYVLTYDLKINIRLRRERDSRHTRERGWEGERVGGVKGDDLMPSTCLRTRTSWRTTTRDSSRWKFDNRSAQFKTRVFCLRKLFCLKLNNALAFHGHCWS